MDKQVFAKIMTYLAIAYGKEFTSEQLNVWYDCLKDLTSNDLKNAVKRIIETKQYMPSIAEIRSEAVTISHNELQLCAEEEFEKVLTAVRKWGTLDNVGFEKITMDTIRAIGQRRLELIETANIPFIKREFIEIWNYKRDGIEKVYTQNVLTYKEEIQKQLLEEDRRLLLDIGEE